MLPVLYATRVRRRYNIPFILEIRDIWPLTAIQIGGFSKYNPFIVLFRKLEKYAYSNADSIISVLSHFNAHLGSVITNYKPFYWIPNAIENNSVFEYQRSSKECKQGKEFILVYAGAVGFSNAMEYLIKAADLLREQTDIKFLIIGDGPAKESLKAMSKGNPQVIFMNKIPKEEVARILKNVDVGLISWKAITLYNYGIAANKYNDYMLAGLPIISASNIVEDPVVIANCGLHVPAEDEKCIAEAILDLYFMHPEERSNFGENGYNYVINHNTYNQIADQYLSCIEETISNFSSSI
jgi:glycosyltransferase involved in cell wall biosynthesis